MGNDVLDFDDQQGTQGSLVDDLPNASELRDAYNNIKRINMPKGEPLGNSAGNSATLEMANSVPQGQLVGEAGKEVGKEAGKEAAKEIGKEAAKEVGKETAKEAGKVGLEVGVDATAGIATGGVGAVISEAVFRVADLTIGAAKKAYDKAKNDALETIHNKKSSSIGTGGKIMLYFWGFTIVIVLMATIAFTPSALYSVVVRFFDDVGNSVEATFTSYSHKAEFFSDLFGEKYDGDMVALCDTQQKVDSQNFYVYKAIVDDAIYESYAYYIRDTAKNPKIYFKGLWDDMTKHFNLRFDYSSKGAEYAYLSKPYLYCLPKDDGTYYTIGDFLDKKIPKEDLNNDLNYAEIIAIFCQNENYRVNGISYSEFYDDFRDEKNARHFYELNFSDSPTWFYMNGDEMVLVGTQEEAEEGGKAGASDTADTTNTDTSEESEDEGSTTPPSPNTWGYYFDVNIYPYGLKDIYEIASCDPYAENYYASAYQNIDVLDTNEGFARSYLGSGLGPAYNLDRPAGSLWINLLRQVGSDIKGRTPYMWITDSVMPDSDGDIKTGGGYGTNLDFVYTPVGESVILDMPAYLRQSDYDDKYRGNTQDTIAQSGCCDCTYVMSADYFWRSTFDIIGISKQYVTSDEQFNSPQFLNDFQMSETRITYKSFERNDFIQNVINSLKNGRPVIIKIEGKWTGGNGVIYHNSTRTHFIVIMGYDDNGFYFYDPGNEDNTNNPNVVPIPYEEFAYVTIINYRLLDTSRTEFAPRYKVNTLLGITQEDKNE